MRIKSLLVKISIPDKNPIKSKFLTELAPSFELKFKIRRIKVSKKKRYKLADEIWHAEKTISGNKLNNIAPNIDVLKLKNLEIIL